MTGRGAAVALAAAALLGAAATPAAAAGDPARGAALAAARACGACHGPAGISAMPLAPSLAGQPADYVTLQMILFRERLRDVPAMTPLAQGLSDAEVEDLAAWAAALPPGPPPDRAARDAERAAAGAAISARMNCGACHLPTYAGRANIPRLAAQREDYLAHAMAGYRDSRRVGADTQMNGLMFGVSDAAIAALAHHLAQQD